MLGVALASGRLLAVFDTVNFVPKTGWIRCERIAAAETVNSKSRQ